MATWRRTSWHDLARFFNLDNAQDSQRRIQVTIMQISRTQHESLGDAEDDSGGRRKGQQLDIDELGRD